MTFSFNLVDQKWIPCVHFDGRLEEFSLRESLARAYELRGVQGDSPLETAALFRMLLAVLHSALQGPSNRSEWAGLWEKGNWKILTVNNYLDKWKGQFDLFDPDKPFYQVADKRVKSKSVISLAMDMASGNNAVFFDHHTEMDGVALSPAKVARTLLVAQCFGLAGLSGLEQKFTDAPWARGIIFLVESDNLFKTLALNMMCYPNEKYFERYSPNDKPAWERDDPHLPVRQIPEGYLDYLTWQNRRILLIPEGDHHYPVVRRMTVAPGLRLDASVLDPMKLYRAGKEFGYMTTRFSEDRALWRDSASLFGLGSTKGVIPPKTFYWLADIGPDSDEYISRQQTFRFMALGMANDKAKVEFFHEEHLPLPLDYLENEALVEKLADALDLADKTGFALRVACQWMALLVVSPKSDGKKWAEVDKISKSQSESLVMHWNVDRYYWQYLEIPFLHFLEDLPGHPGALQTWKETLPKVAWDALEKTAGFAGTDAIALKAAVRARGILGNSLQNVFPEIEKEVSA